VSKGEHEQLLSKKGLSVLWDMQYCSRGGVLIELHIEMHPKESNNWCLFEAKAHDDDDDDDDTC
jgi:hypothetical protein